MVSVILTSVACVFIFTLMIVGSIIRAIKGPTRCDICTQEIPLQNKHYTRINDGGEKVFLCVHCGNKLNRRVSAAAFRAQGL